MTNLQQKISLVLPLLLIVFSNAQNIDPDAAPSTGFNAQTAVTMTVLVSGFFLLGFFSLYIRHCTSVRYHTRGGGGGVNILGGAAVERGLDAAVIESFPTFTYSSVKGLKIGMGVLECAVCLNEFQDDVTLRLIPKCDHVFHPHCIDAWLTSHSTCPVCRADLVPVPGGEVFVDVPFNIVSEPESEPKSNKPGSEKLYPDGSDSGRSTCHGQSPDFVIANQNVVPRSWTKSPMAFKFIGIFRRSHTTGHSLDEVVGENMERFTLRLPEEVRNQIINSTLNRTKSCAAHPGLGSENRSVWKGFSMTPPFFARSGSVPSPTLEAAKSLSRSLKSPFHRLFFGVDRGSSSSSNGGGGVNNNVGERSFDRLKNKDVV